MQSLAFLWFQLQMTQQYLRGKTFGPAQSPANSANWNTPIGRCNSDKALYSNTPALHHSAGRDSSTSTKRLIRTVLYIAIAAFVQQARCSQLESFTSDVQATVSVVHPDGKVELRKITINRDFGDKLEISQGLSTSDQVILNPSDSLTDGMSVRIAEPGSLQASSR
jgi:hypothetical protein